MFLASEVSIRRPQEIPDVAMASHATMVNRSKNDSVSYKAQVKGLGRQPRHICIRFEIVLPNNDRADIKAVETINEVLKSHSEYQKGVERGVKFEIKAFKHTMHGSKTGMQIGELILS